MFRPAGRESEYIESNADSLRQRAGGFTNFEDSKILLLMWPDNETVEDMIGFRVHAELIAEVVSDPKLLPITMGVFGDWGNGKTSIMKMLEKQLKQDEEVAVLYFDAWLFEGYDDAKSALISSILKQLAKHTKFPPALKKDAANLLARVNWMRVLKMGWDNVALPAVLAYATGGATVVPSIIGALKGIFSPAATTAGGEGCDTFSSKNLESLLNESEQTEIMEVRDFREAFGKLLSDTKFKALIVLIDDLDRCSPERIVENLEAIKLFLNVGNTAFVIGADPRIVRHAIAVRYHESLEAAKASAVPGEKSEEAGAQLVNDYLEKLIQVPYHLPRLSPAEIETYMTLLFAQRDLEGADFRKCLDACETRRANNRFGSFGLADVQTALGGKALPSDLKSALSFTAGAAPLFTENLKGNPRQVKRFLNAFTLRRKLSKVARMDSLKDDVLLKLMLLEYANETRFRELVRWHEEQQKTPAEIISIEKEEGFPANWDTVPLRRWSKMEPLLSEVDLSDYFWLVRDRLGSSLLGLSLIPPVVRTAYELLLSETGRKKADIQLAELRDDEIDGLVALLTQHAQRDPSDGAAYDALLKIVEVKNDKMPSFATVIRQLPAATLPGWLDGKLQVLARTKTSLRGQVDELVAYIKGTEGVAGKSARNRR